MSVTSAGNPPAKADTAFRTIGELADELGLPQHILRYWETRFPQLRPLQRAGKRRYYRPADVALVRRIDRLLNHEGYTVRGVQKLLETKDAALAPLATPVEMPVPAPPSPGAIVGTAPAPAAEELRERLIAIRAELVAALGEA